MPWFFNSLLFYLAFLNVKGCWNFISAPLFSCPDTKMNHIVKFNYFCMICNFFYQIKISCNFLCPDAVIQSQNKRLICIFYNHNKFHQDAGSESEIQDQSDRRKKTCVLYFYKLIKNLFPQNRWKHNAEDSEKWFLHSL